MKFLWLQRWIASRMVKVFIKYCIWLAISRNGLMIGWDQIITPSCRKRIRLVPKRGVTRLSAADHGQVGPSCCVQRLEEGPFQKNVLRISVSAVLSLTPNTVHFLINFPEACIQSRFPPGSGQGDKSLSALVSNWLSLIHI